METLFYLLLSDGAFETESFWYTAQDGLLALYNGGDEVQTFETALSSSAPCLLYGTPVLTVSQGVLRLEIPPCSLVVLADKDGRGFVKDGILYREPIEDSTVQCENDAVAAVYKEYNGILELTGMYRSGDIIKDGDVQFQFFRWDKELRPIKN
ncbi:MAG: hypothetical protein IJN25_02775 [Clostridia bacterium]|nr:hypothetical protein [Clostridia bacterium]